MIEVYTFEGGVVKSDSLEGLGNTTKCWAHCVNPTEKELLEISEKANIPIEDLKEVLDHEERPKVSDLENYSLIIVRAPWVENDEITTTPLSLFISKNKNNVISIALKGLSSVHRIKQLVEIKKIDMAQHTMSFFIYKLLDEVFNTYFSILSTLEEKIENLEDAIVVKAEGVKVHSIFAIKKTLIFFHKALTATRDVIASIEKEYVVNIDKKNIKRFRALYNDVTQLIDMVGTYRDILTSTLEIYLSAVSNNLNKTIKTLTIISSFVLIPTLIASIYGMNFDTSSVFNLPELGWRYGYIFSLGLMLISTVLTYLFFRKKGWM